MYIERKCEQVSIAPEVLANIGPRPVSKIRPRLPQHLKHLPKTNQKSIRISS